MDFVVVSSLGITLSLLVTAISTKHDSLSVYFMLFTLSRCSLPELSTIRMSKIKVFIVYNPFLLSCLLSANNIKKIITPIDNNNKNIIWLIFITCAPLKLPIDFDYIEMTKRLQVFSLQSFIKLHYLIKLYNWFGV